MNLLSGNLTTTDGFLTYFGVINKTVASLSAFALIGVLLAASFLLLDKEGDLSESAVALWKKGQIFAAIWLISSGMHILVTLANILGTPLTGAIDGISLRSFVTQVDLGRYLAIQLLLIASVLISIFFIKKVLSSSILLAFSLITLVIPVFQSHAAAAGSHSLAIGALVIHVLALSLWVGGILSLIMISPKDRSLALPRFSQLALWAAIAAVISGIVSAWIRLNFQSAWSTAYSRVIALKIIFTVILLGMGYLNRKSLKDRDVTTWGNLFRLISVEAVIMSITALLGNLLSSSQPPVSPEIKFSPALSIIGVATPEAPSFARLLLLYNPDSLTIGVLIVLVALYIKGVLILSRRGDKWPVGRTISFACGVALLDFATSGGLGVYALFSFEYHMIAHMVIGMLAPIAFVLGAPITLALRTLPQGRTSEERGVRGTLITFLHTRYSVILTNPLTALALFDGSLFVLYFTNLFGDLMQSHAGHLFMNIHFFLAGFLFFHVIIGIDPNPRKIPHLIRIVMLFAAMSIHAFFAISLLSTTTLIDQGYYKSLQTPWLGDLLADQHAAGAIAWGMGEIPIILALIATFIQWMRDDSREAKRIDRNEARMAAMGEPDELAQYNNYLNQLRRRDQREGQL